VFAVAGAALTYEIVSTRPVRETMRRYSELVALGNRVDLTDADRLAAARALCSNRYVASGRLALAPEGGIAGLPRTISKNFQAWREGPNVWICPTNRIGPVYQFVRERGQWQFDGQIAMLHPGGVVEKTGDEMSIDPD
jgi:hypothetical protein